MPEKLQIHRLVFNIVVCTIGAILIFWFRKKHGPLPDATEEVMGKIKKTGKYPHNNLGTIAVAVCGFFLPDTMFSGEHQLGPLINDWQSYDVGLLLLTGFFKLALVSICINFAWRGGSIFPIIFGSAAVGFAFALLFGIDGPFAAVMTISATYAYISRKPVTTLALLLLCVPLTYAIPVLITVFVAAKVPHPRLKLSRA